MTTLVNQLSTLSTLKLSKGLVEFLKSNPLKGASLYADARQRILTDKTFDLELDDAKNLLIFAKVMDNLKSWSANAHEAWLLSKPETRIKMGDAKQEKEDQEQFMVAYLANSKDSTTFIPSDRLAKIIPSKDAMLLRNLATAAHELSSLSVDQIDNNIAMAANDLYGSDNNEVTAQQEVERDLAIVFGKVTNPLVPTYRERDAALSQEEVKLKAFLDTIPSLKGVWAYYQSMPQRQDRFVGEMILEDLKVAQQEGGNYIAKILAGSDQARLDYMKVMAHELSHRGGFSELQASYTKSLESLKELKKFDSEDSLELLLKLKAEKQIIDSDTTREVKSAIKESLKTSHIISNLIHDINTLPKLSENEKNFMAKVHEEANRMYVAADTPNRNLTAKEMYSILVDNYKAWGVKKTELMHIMRHIRFMEHLNELMSLLNLATGYASAKNLTTGVTAEDYIPLVSALLPNDYYLMDRLNNAMNTLDTETTYVDEFGGQRSCYTSDTTYAFTTLLSAINDKKMLIERNQPDAAKIQNAALILTQYEPELVKISRTTSAANDYKAELKSEIEAVIANHKDLDLPEQVVVDQVQVGSNNTVDTLMLQYKQKRDPNFSILDADPEFKKLAEKYAKLESLERTVTSTAAGPRQALQNAKTEFQQAKKQGIFESGGGFIQKLLRIFGFSQSAEKVFTSKVSTFFKSKPDVEKNQHASPWKKIR